jgi:hypothetical protein
VGGKLGDPNGAWNKRIGDLDKILSRRREGEERVRTDGWKGGGG